MSCERPEKFELCSVRCSSATLVDASGCPVSTTWLSLNTLPPGSRFSATEIENVGGAANRPGGNGSAWAVAVRVESKIAVAPSSVACKQVEYAKCLSVMVTSSSSSLTMDDDRRVLARGPGSDERWRRHDRTRGRHLGRQPILKRVEPELVGRRDAGGCHLCGERAHDAGEHDRAARVVGLDVALDTERARAGEARLGQQRSQARTDRRMGAGASERRDHAPRSDLDE